jgi:hypothetical protein
MKQRLPRYGLDPKGQASLKINKKKGAFSGLNE